MSALLVKGGQLDLLLSFIRDTSDDAERAEKVDVLRTHIAAMEADMRAQSVTAVHTALAEANVPRSDGVGQPLWSEAYRVWWLREQRDMLSHRADWIHPDDYQTAVGLLRHVVEAERVERLPGDHAVSVALLSVDEFLAGIA